MKTLLYISLLCCLLFSVSGCDQSKQIRAKNQKSMLQSFLRIKRGMGFAKGTEFEVAFWSLKQKSADNATFMALVNGKQPEEIVAMGKQYFTERKQANDPDYQHESWDTMMTEVIAQIKTPATKKTQSKATPRQNKANRIQGY
jgi:hypothetical protein